MHTYASSTFSWTSQRQDSSAHHAVGLDVGGQRVDAVAHALLHQVHVAAQLAAVVHLAHVATVIVPAGALLDQLKQGVIFTGHEDVYEEEEEEYVDTVNKDVSVGALRIMLAV